MRAFIFKNFIAVILGVIAINANSNAIDGFLLNIGSGMNDSLIQYKNIQSAKQFSLGMFWETETTFQHALFGYSELEIESYWSKIEKQDESMQVIAVRPVLSFWQSPEKSQAWYWQLGVGLSYFNQRHLHPIELSSKPQFATVVGLGTTLDKQQKHRLTLRYNHYSNAYLKRPNYGLDTLTLDWHYRF
ncbi:acyloxyacyl hydrolase [Aliikangiella sp. IMCC44653]